MAPLKVIGAGYGRTGTASLQLALNMLGYNTHHMRSMLTDETQHAEPFLHAFLHPEDPVDWDKIYQGYDAAVDWPTVSFLEPLMKQYPDAKFILTVRDPDSWYTSVKNTIFGAAKNQYEQNVPERIMKLREMVRTIVLDGAFGDLSKFEDEEKIKDMFVRHIEWVKANIPADRLLIMNLGEDGWEKLCPFLGKPMPPDGTPYPKTNSTQEMKAMQQKLIQAMADGTFDAAMDDLKSSFKSAVSSSSQ